MYRALPYKTKQFFFVLIKLSIVIGAFYFIYNKLTSNSELNFNDFTTFLTENEVFSLKNIVFLLILSVFNWFFEIKKWQLLVSSIKKISFLESLKQSLGSLTASLFTPNRIGDYGAKAFYYTSRFRKKIVLLNFIGNMLQMSVTILLGGIGLYYFITEYDITFNFRRVSRFFVVIMLISLFSVLGIKQNRYKIKGFAIEKIQSFIKNLSFNLKALGFILSLLRYLIFSYQFYYLLLIFGVEVSYLHAMTVITSMYLLASLIPSIFIFDVIIKGSVAVYVFSKVGVNEFTILSIVLLMWVLNFVLPSIIGSYYVLTFKFPNTQKT